MRSCKTCAKRTLGYGHGIAQLARYPRGAGQRDPTLAHPWESHVAGSESYRSGRAEDARVTSLLARGRETTSENHATDTLAQAHQELQTLREELVRLARVEASRVLASGFAHELKQPLAAIRANAQFARQRLGEQEQASSEAHAALDDIIRDTARAFSIVDRFREFSQRGSPKFENCDINALVRDIALSLRSEALARKIQLDCQLDHVPAALADRVYLEQLLVNLVMNAFDAVERPNAQARSVTVRTSSGSMGAVITVEDRGPLLADEFITRLEEPFYTSKPEGVGLGLSICRHILELHGSELRMARNPSGGMSFCFELPRVQRR